MSPRNLMLIVLACCLVKDAFYAEAAPSVGYNELTAVFPRSIAELVVSDEFERIWRKAAADRMAERFGGRDDDGTPPTTRNAIGEYMMSDEFHQAVCKAGSQGMSGMAGMMGNAPPPWSSIVTFVGSDKFAHGTCDMMSQGMLQFGQSVNGFGRSDAQDPEQAVDEFFRSRYYADATERLRTMFSDVVF